MQTWINAQLDQKSWTVSNLHGAGVIFRRVCSSNRDNELYTSTNCYKKITIDLLGCILIIMNSYFSLSKILTCSSSELLKYCLAR